MNRVASPAAPSTIETIATTRLICAPHAMHCGPFGVSIQTPMMMSQAHANGPIQVLTASMGVLRCKNFALRPLYSNNARGFNGPVSGDTSELSKFFASAPLGAEAMLCPIGRSFGRSVAMAIPPFSRQPKTIEPPADSADASMQAQTLFANQFRPIVKA